MLIRSKLINLESKISEALINSEISHDGFMTMINEKKKKYWESNGSIRMMNSQICDAEKNRHW